MLGFLVDPRSATVSVAQNNPSKAANSQRSDLTSGLPPAIHSQSHVSEDIFKKSVTDDI